MANETPSTAVQLSTKPTDELKREILHRFWRLSKELIELDDYATYFEYYWKTCHSLRLGDGSRADSLAVDTHVQLLLIIDCLWKYRDTEPRGTRATLRADIRQKVFNGESDERINASIDLVLRLWLTMNIGKHEPKAASKTIPWNDVSYFSSFIQTQFRESGPDEQRAKVVLGRDMTAVKLKNISGISIQWTRNLNDHLSYIRHRRCLKVYELDQVLQDHQER